MDLPLENQEAEDENGEDDDESDDEDPEELHKALVCWPQWQPRHDFH